MKIRNDFVSNSSSSSFLISTDNDYSTKDLVRDISINCKCDYWDNETKMNRILSNYVSLFVGGIRIADTIQYYNKNDPLFDYHKNLIDKFGDRLGDRLVYTNDDHTTIKDQMRHYQDYIVTVDHMKEILKLEGEDLLNYINNAINFEDDVLDDNIPSSSYIINEDSIAITEKLMVLGKEFQTYDKLTYESIKDMILNKKQKLYNIRINTDGDGCDEDCFRFERSSHSEYIDGAFDGINVKILTSESF